MKEIILNIVRNFLISSSVAIFIGFLLVSMKVGGDDLFGYVTIGFSLTFVSRYSKFLQICSTHVHAIPLIGRSGGITLLMSLVVSISMFMFLMTCLNIFHGEMSISKNIKWTNFSSIIFIITAAAMEETFFRGYLLEFLRIRCGMKIATLIASIVFAIAHYPHSLHLLDFFFYFSFATCLTMVVFKFNSLLPGIVYHSVSNYGIGLTRLDLDGIFFHSGIFRFENGDPSNAYMFIQIVTFSIVIAIFYWLVIFKNPEKNSIA